MPSLDVEIRVRYKETDAMGVVHHSNYVNYYEVARTELLRSFGTSYHSLEQAGIMLPVREVKMEYFAPAYYDDLLTIRVSINEMPRVKIVFDYEIFNPAGELLNRGQTTLVYVDAATRKPIRAPKWHTDFFADAFEEQN